MDRFCPVCGRKQKSSAKYCNECGANMSPSATRKVELLDNRYQVESILKSGNMGCVYRAVDTRLGETVAVKKMQSAFDPDADIKKIQEMFLREAKLLAKLHHGGLPKVTDYFTEKDSDEETCHYLVMTFIEGMDLECYLRQNIPPLPLDEAMGYFHQILDIFSYLHSQTPPVIYRDLKPSNIIINNGRLHLVDFGIAKILKPLQKGTMLGTQGYASPDQCRGNDSPLNDIYSLGVLIHYLLTGLDPEDPSRPLFTFEPVRNFNKNVPEFLDDLIMSMVDIKSANRPGSVDGIIEILDGGDGRYPTTAHTSAHARVLSPPSHYSQKQFDRYDDFFEAVKNGNITEVEAYINQGADVNAKDNDEHTPLHFATFNGHTDIVKFLISKGADINAKDDDGRTPLYYASAKGYTDIINLLISNGADINAKENNGWTPIHYAARHGHTDIIKLLISKGADINAKENDGWTPLHHAASPGHADIIKLLISKGADVNAKNNIGWTPLHMAASEGYTDVVELLISKGADINANEKNGRTPLQYVAFLGHTDIIKLLISKGADINTKEKNGRTPLQAAALKGYTDIVGILISNGADINAKDKDGWTPLHHAIYNNHTDTTKLLIHKGADVNEKNNDGKTPLQFAKSGGSDEITNLLGGTNLDKKVSRKRIPWGLSALSFILLILLILAPSLFIKLRRVYTNNFDGRTHLHHASYCGKTDLAKLIISEGANVNAKDNYGTTPLHDAVWKGSIDITSLLIAKGADVNAKNNNGTTPMHDAAWNGNTDTAKLLISKGANVNAKDNNGTTPLHNAVGKGHNDIVMLLISKGASINAKDKGGWTALRLAADRGHTDIVNLLRKHGAR